MPSESQSHYYTRNGDDGLTRLLGPERVPKSDPRPEAFGTVDEVQAVLGLARSSGCSPRTAEILLTVQRDLYPLMAELAVASEGRSPFRGSITPEHVGQMEGWIAEIEGQVEMPREFVVPGDTRVGAALHLARTVARRAERAVVRLTHEGFEVNKQILRYLNRLSSLLFALAILEARQEEGRPPTLVKGS